MLTTLLLSFSISTQASHEPRTAVIRGEVHDQQGAAVPGAAVDIACGSDHQRTVSGPTGEFAATGLPAGRCVVTTEAERFEPERTPVDLTPGSIASPTVVLRIKGFATQVVVTPTRGVEEQSFSVPEAVSVTSRQDIDSRPYQLLPQVLREEPGILVQQTTSGQASPIIRGFTGQSNVYLFDGVRFNTSAWRGGPSQYFGWIDGSIVDRMEIVRGPGSVQYGSDALGGTVNVLAAQPSFSDRGTHFGGSVAAIVGSGDRSAGGDVDLVVRGTSAAFRFGASTRHVQDLRGGGGLDSHAAVTRFLGLRSDTFGSRMRDTGFDQSSGSIVGSVRASDTATLSTVFLHEKQTGASRYDRIFGGDGLYRSGFAPQVLDFGLVRYQKLGLAGFDALSATISVNRQADGRYEQTRPTARVDSQQATTTAYGYQLQGRHRAGARHQLAVGAELYDETIRASRSLLDPTTGVAQASRPDIPDGTSYTSLGVFAQDVTELVPGRVSVRGGLRYGRFGFATVSDPTQGVTTEHVTMQAVTFHAGTVISLPHQLNATFTVSRGFRAANAADLGGIGLTGGGGFEIAPSRAAALGGIVGTTTGSDAVSTGLAVPALGPEVLYLYEPGLKFRNGRFGAAVSAYDLEFIDSIQRRAIVFPANVVGLTISGYQIVRQDANGLAYIAQDIRPIATRANEDRARILGFEADADVRIGRQWTGRVFFSRASGHLLSTGEYLRRMPPPLGGARLRWSGPGDRRWVEGVVSFAGAQSRFNSGDVSDARIGGLRTRSSIASFFNGTAADLGLVRGGVLLATGETLAQVQNRVLGSAASAPLFDLGPGFVVVGARAGWRVSPQFEVAVIGENLTDRNYRLYGSGVDAPGINVQVRTRYRF